MEAAELRRRIAKLRREKKEEEARKRLRGMERGAIAETREARRERRISGIGLAIEKAKVYKALPLPHIRPRDEEESIRRAEQRAERAEAEAKRQIALSQRRTEAARASAAASKAEAEQRVEERKATGARLMSEKELRAARLRPYTEAAKGVGKVGKEVGKGVLGLGKDIWRGLEYLGKEGKKAPRKPEGEEPPVSMEVDLGFGKSERKEPPLDLHIKIE